MKINNELYVKYADDSGQQYYCPINVIQNDHAEPERDLNDCVEVSTAGRYSGNLTVMDQPSE